jgi:hypothetical protein
MVVPRETTLINTEMMIGGYVGTGRQVQALNRRMQGRADCDELDSWTKHVEGAQGEMATAKVLNIYWQPIIGDPEADDVGPYQVRTNGSRRLDDMVLRPWKDKPDRVYISVLCFAPRFVVLGWILGADGMQQQWYRDGSPGRPKAFWVPRNALHDLDELPLPQDLARVA